MSERDGLTRRKFLKMLGLGAGAVAAVGSPIGSLLSLGLEKGKSAREAVVSLEDVEVRRSEPDNPEEGQVWLREDLEGEE